jgi:hypothetical protein
MDLTLVTSLKHSMSAGHTLWSAYPLPVPVASQMLEAIVARATMYPDCDNPPLELAMPAG